MMCYLFILKLVVCLYFQRNKDRKPRAKMARSLTNEEEDDVIEWLKSNRFLYDKSSFEFKNRQKKERVWLEMEQKMQLNPGDLYRWYMSLRTQYVKEVKKRENTTRSGAGATEEIMTPRITWLLEKFEFVKPYVCQSRATRGSKIQRAEHHSDCSESSVTQQTTRENTPQLVTSSKTASISDYLEKVSQQLVVPKSDIEKTCDFLGVLMAKMTPSLLEEFTHEVTTKAMEYVKQSNLERQTQQPPQVTLFQPPQPPLRYTQQLKTASQPGAPQFTTLQAPPPYGASSRPLLTTSATVLRHTQQPQMTTDYIMARNLAASNPPGDVLQQQGHYTWTEIQPTNLQPILPDQLQPSAYSTPVRSGTQTPTTTAPTSTDTAAVLSSAFQALNSNTSLNSAFNLSDYVPATPKGPTSTTDTQWTVLFNLCYL